MTVTVRKRASKRKPPSTGALHSRADTILRRNHPEVWKLCLTQAHGGLEPKPDVPQDQTIPARLLTIVQAADRIGVSAWTLAEWKKKGYLLPSFELGTEAGMQSLYTTQDVIRGRKVREQTRPGRKMISNIGWKSAHNAARAKLRQLYEAEHRQIVESLRAQVKQDQLRRAG